jgi:tRNA dimethylallyltransferase
MLNIPLTTRNNLLVFLFGPTGVGKTELLQHLFPQGCEVVNADSKQVYRYLDIGSAKPDPEILAQIPHHLVSIKDPWEQFSVGEFVQLADQACADIHQRGNVPVVCGGTAYYFKHFYYGLPKSPKSDPEIRQRVAQLCEEHGAAWCYDYLRQVDPLSAEKIHPSDIYRITRALEVYETSGRPLSSYQVPDTARGGMKPLIIGLHRDRDELNKRIELRVNAMFDAGLEEEFAHLLKMGAQEDWPGMQGIGYREFFLAQHDLSMSRSDVQQLIVQNSRRYAKRQMTFFSRLDPVHWVHPDDIGTLEQLIAPFI